MRKRKIWESARVPVGCFAVLMLMLLGVVNRGTGFTDEADNFLGGMAVASGRSIYKDFASQHMPVMYYICAVLYLLGADTIYTFRLFFYVLLAILWTIVAVRYRKKLGIIVSLGSGMLYITNMFTEYTCCILAEQLQSIGVVVLLMEFLLFAEKKELDWKNNLMISAAVFLSFGSAFVSIFAVFAIALAFFYVKAAWCIRQKVSFLAAIREIFGTFWKTAVWVAAPFAVLLIYYAFDGSLYDFIYGAYTINREFYPKYLGGYGNSILISFVEPVINYFKTVGDGARDLIAAFGITKQYLTSVRQFMCYVVNVIFWICYARKKSVGEAVLIAYFTMMCGTRGFSTEFHGLPYVAVTMFMAAYLIAQYAKYAHVLRKGRTMMTAVVAGAVLVYTCHYMVACRSVMLMGQNMSLRYVEDETHISYWVNRLTEEDEEVLLTTTETGILVEAARVPYKTGASTPWMYEAFAEEEIANLIEDSPRVAVYQTDYNIWGNFIQEYAPEFCAFIEENYTQLDAERFTELYVRNDYLEEAREIYGEAQK